MSNLYQDAILDAKALRASAMANAKAALEEAFEPKIQEMLRLKLSEELEEVAELEEENAVEENIEEKMEGGVEENYDINENELEEILAQLEELSQTHEAEMKDDAKMEGEGEIELSLNEAEEADEEEDEEEAGEEAEVEDEEGAIGDDTKVIDITLGDLKQVLQSVMPGQQALDIPSDDTDSADLDSEKEAEVSLEEILAELEAEGAEDVQSTGYEAGHQVREDGLEEDLRAGVYNDFAKWKESFPEGTEFKQENGYMLAVDNSGKELGKWNPVSTIGMHADDVQYKSLEEELEEAKTTIKTLRQDLQEVNLLNAKYLYMNKLFKSKTLTESQKVKVINALDRAASVAEVKNTYETLKESFEAKKQLKESIGFASQAAGVAPKQPIIESDNMMSRWQKLAGIK